MLLHGGRGVEGGQRVVELLQVAVAEAPVVQVVTQTRDQQPFALEGQGSATQTFTTKKRGGKRGGGGDCCLSCPRSDPRPSGGNTPLGSGVLSDPTSARLLAALPVNLGATDFLRSPSTLGVSAGGVM